MRRHEVELAAALLLSGLPLGQRSTLSAICILLSRSQLAMVGLLPNPCELKACI